MTKAYPQKTQTPKGKLSEEAKKARELLKSDRKELNYLIPLLDVLGNENRLKVIYILFHKERLCVTDLCDALKMSAPALSQHLRKMREARIVKTEKEHKTVYYSIQKKYRPIIKDILTATLS